MRRKLSIRRFLVGRLLAFLVPIVAVGILLHWRAERGLLIEVFEEQLVERARALAALAAERDQPFSPRGLADYMPEYGEGGDHYFHVWLPDGTELARSASLGGVALERRVGAAERPVVVEGVGPGEAPVRAVGVRFPGSEGAEGGAEVEVLVGARRELLDASLRRGLLEVLLTGGISAAAIFVAVLLTLRRSTLAIRRVVASIQRIDPRRLDRPLGLDDVPEEIHSIVEEVNRAMGTTAAVLERERSFSANVAHALRTPISEIQLTTEIALRYPDASTPQEALAEAHDAARKMGGTVEALLQLADLEASDRPADATPFDLTEIVRSCVEDLGPEQRPRVELDLPASCPLEAGAGAWSVLCDSLLDNALEYAPPGEGVGVRVVEKGGGAELVVSNRAPHLRPADLPHLTERLWRAPGTPAVQRRHSGLGLSIVAACAQALGAELDFGLEGAVLSVRVTLPPASERA